MTPSSAVGNRIGPFTETAIPSVEHELETLMADLVDQVRDLPGLESLLLGGSLGRGEATVRPIGDDYELASDIEVYLVGRPASLRAAARRLERSNASSHLSVAWLHPGMLRAGRAKNLSWRSAPTIRMYEIGAASKILFGRRPSMRPIDPRRLPLAEGVRLILNRLAEATPELESGSADAGRWLDKILMACGDTLLLAQQRYRASYRERMESLRHVVEPWSMPSGWRALVTAAYERKLRAGVSSPNPIDVDRVAAATLDAASIADLDVPLEPMGTFAQRFTVAAARNAGYLRYLPPVGNGPRYEAFVLLVRGWRSGMRPTARMLAQATHGRPLSLALQAASAPLFFGIVRNDTTLVEASDRALRWAGVVADQDPSATAGTRLRRHWLVAT